MKSTLRIFVIGNVLAVLLSAHVHAQLPRGGAAERERGLFNRMGARREERFNRNAPPPVTQPPANTANPAAANARAGLLGNNSAAASAAARGGNGTSPANNRLPNQGAGLSGRTPQLAPSLNSPINAPVNPASANMARSTGAPQSNLNPYASGYGPSDAATGELPPNRLPASDTSRGLMPNRLPYDGPGVLIRLPERLRGEVNYLVDDTEHLIVHSGEAQHLRIKDRYEVRFSRGVKPDGQSFGEARYTITEGVYRFDVTSSGWELYREGEASDVQLAVRQAEQQAERMMQAAKESERDAQVRNEDSDIRDRDSEIRETQGRETSGDTLPSPAPKETATEDTLPAPRSILEPT